MGRRTRHDEEHGGPHHWPPWGHHHWSPEDALRFHRWRHMRRRRLGPLGRYVRTKLRRRLFFWMGGTVFMATLAAAMVMGALARFDDAGGTWWSPDVAKSKAWMGAQFERTWDDPAARERYTRELHEAFGASLVLKDAQGAVLAQAGDDCRRAAFELPVMRAGQALGQVRVCLGGHAPAPWRPISGVAVVVLLFWFATGAIARRLARPLDELAQVTKRIGAGDLSARAELGSHMPDEIGAVTQAVNEMAAHLERQLKDQKELLAAVSHELRTPLARVRLISELARDGGASPKTFDDLDREVTEMDALVGELLAKSRVDFGALALRSTDVRQVAVEALERLALPPELLQAEEGLPLVNADPTLLSRALVNLLDNARKHAGGADLLLLRPEQGGVVLEVHDRGPGLPQGEAAQRFEAFAQGDRTKEGLGLGLSLVRRIAEAHGGQVFARARDGGGAVVGLSLPRADPARPA